MKTIFFILIGFFISFTMFSQTSSRVLEQSEVNIIFTAQVKKTLKINFSIYKVYEYNDNSGKYYLVLTEKEYSNDGLDVLNDSLKAFNFQYKNNEFSTIWTINDFRRKNSTDEPNETSIWFWTKYSELNDIDNDGLIDPIIVYGTSGNNDIEDGRIKILVFYKGQKRAIRHQNSPMDFGRHTQVDKEFYDLPVSIQNKINEIMEELTENNHAIFPYGWQNAMKNKLLKFDEN